MGKERPLLSFALPSVLTSSYLFLEAVNLVPGVEGHRQIHIYMFSYITSGFLLSPVHSQGGEAVSTKQAREHCQWLTARCCLEAEDYSGRRELLKRANIARFLNQNGTA